MSARKIDRLSFERELWGKGLRLVAGVDEAGRGPLAGPVAAAAVIFPRSWLETGLDKRLHNLNDSKQLTAAQRDEFFAIITAHSEIRYAVAVIESTVIDEVNILRATHLAMNRALEQLLPAPDHVLVDGNPVPLRFPSTAIVKGDALSYSIAAASVIAKVTRDRLMVEYDQKYPGYGFAAHKGYGTAEHLEAITSLGPCPIHRQSFAPMRTLMETRDLFKG